MRLRGDWREVIGAAWKHDDILVLFFDINRYPASAGTLTNEEIHRADTFKSEYFKKRFVLSRTLLRMLLHEIIGNECTPDIVLSRNPPQGIESGYQMIPWISLSYSCNYLSITLAKQKAACDIEKIRYLDIKNIDKYPVFQGMERDEVSDNRVRLWKRWTEIEAYAKFSGVPLFLCLQGFSQGGNGYFSRSYLINNELIVTVMSERHNPLIAFISGNDNANSMKYAIV